MSERKSYEEQKAEEEEKARKKEIVEAWLDGQALAKKNFLPEAYRKNVEEEAKKALVEELEELEGEKEEDQNKSKEGTD